VPFPPALAALSIWESAPTQGSSPWVTTGPVTPFAPGNYSIVAPAIAFLLTSSTTASAPPESLIELQECVLNSTAEAVANAVAIALTLPGECGGSGLFAAGSILRVSGWVVDSLSAASALGWASVRQPETGQYLSSTPGALTRCKRASTAKDRRGATPVGYVFSAAFNDPSCSSAGAGFVTDVQLGWAFGVLSGIV
jgi:hypothetical protein